MTDLDLAELERLAKRELEKPEPRYLTSFDYPAEVDESNLDDLARYLFDAVGDWVSWNIAGTILALVARVREAEARIEKVLKLVDRALNIDDREDLDDQDDWQEGYDDAREEIYLALAEGDEQ